MRKVSSGVADALRVSVIVIVGSLCLATTGQAQTLLATGGFVEPATSTAIRPTISASQAAALLPARGMFTFSGVE